MPTAYEAAQGYLAGLRAASQSRDPAHMTDAELVATWLRSAEVGQSALSLAQEMLDACGGLGGLLLAPTASRARPGLARRQAELQLAVELCRRALDQQLRTRDVFGSPDAVKAFLQLHLARKPHEEFAVLFLDAQNRLIEMKILFRGTLTQTSVYPREIVVSALQLGASGVVLAHNHPSGTPEPSRADEALTQTIKAAMALVDVRVLDHIIVAPGRSLSMAEKGLL